MQEVHMLTAETLFPSNAYSAICSPSDGEWEHSICAAADAGYGAAAGSFPAASEEAAAALPDLVRQ